MGQQSDIEEQGLQDEFRTLKNMSLMTSGSLFAALEENSGADIIVSSKQAAEEAEVLIGELKELFKSCNRMVRRAVMANTLAQLPVFFETPQEVADYITVSLSQCDDEAEKYASKQLMMEIMN